MDLLELPVAHEPSEHHIEIGRAKHRFTLGGRVSVFEALEGFADRLPANPVNPARNRSSAAVYAAAVPFWRPICASMPS